MKKNFLPYLPARLVIGANQWHIVFYQTDPSTRKRSRFRQTFELNRIKDLKIRRQTANSLIQRINELLPKGYPYLIDINGNSFLPSKVLEEYFESKHQIVVNPALEQTNILDGVEVARKILCQTDRNQTINSYNSRAGQFCKWLISKKLDQLELRNFTPKLAGEFMDYWILEQKVRNSTYNNKLIFAKLIFNTLIERDYLTKNPFRYIKYKKAGKKLRRNFTEEERDIVACYIKEHDTWLYYGLLLQYYCFVRPTEMRRLRFKDFDLKTGLIFIYEDTAKNSKYYCVTMPEFILEDFRKPIFSSQQPGYLLFGTCLKPHPLKAAGKNEMNRRHRGILEALQKRKQLVNIEGLSWYSWKDTGATDIAPYINPRDLQEQMRHSSLEITERYLHKRKIIESIKTLKNRTV